MVEEKEKKVYKTFQEIPMREYMYFPKGSNDMGKPGKFSRVEIFHIITSMFVLTISFSLLLTKNNLFYAFSNGFDFVRLINFLPIALIGITTGFFFHEISHKLMAQKFGLWSEYRMYPRGLVISLLISVLLPFVFAAPGAVMFRGESRTFETGRIAMTGPLANIVISIVMLPLYLFVFFETDFASVFGFICIINAFLALFNLLPFGPLDGMKIWSWNANVWIFMLIVSAGLTIFTFQKIPPVF